MTDFFEEDKSSIVCNMSIYPLDDIAYLVNLKENGSINVNSKNIDEKENELIFNKESNMNRSSAKRNYFCKFSNTYCFIFSCHKNCKWKANHYYLFVN